MKQFLIRYRRTEGSPEDWHREIGKFIAAINSDPALNARDLGRNGRGDAGRDGGGDGDLARAALAGAPGFEPGNGGIKIPCLTTWLRPIRRRRTIMGPTPER
jgi:hypothetical protein